MKLNKERYLYCWSGSLVVISVLVVAAYITFDSIMTEASKMLDVHAMNWQQFILLGQTTDSLLIYAAEVDPGARKILAKAAAKNLEALNQRYQQLVESLQPDDGWSLLSKKVQWQFIDEVELDRGAQLFIRHATRILSQPWSPELLSSAFLTRLQNITKHTQQSLAELIFRQNHSSEARILELRSLTFFLLGAIICVIVIIAVFVFRPLFGHISARELELHYLANIDPLASCHNRRSFLHNAEIEFQRSKRTHKPYSVLFLDIDYLKTINDTYGHAIGDFAIQKFAQVCQSNIRDIDTLGRIGGDEFGILLPECSAESAKQTADRIHCSMSRKNICSGGDEIPLGFSIGIATLIDSDSSADDTIIRADHSLYREKRRRKNASARGES